MLILIIFLTFIIYSSRDLGIIRSILTYDKNDLINVDLDQYKKQLHVAKNLILPLEEELALLEQLNSFELGKFLLKNRGLNGYWASYVINAQPTDLHDNPLEKWLLFASYGMNAMRERFYIFRTQLNKYIKSNMRIGSIPCGVMDDLLNLNYVDLHNIDLVGIDINHDSIQLARTNANNHNIKNVNFFQLDVWKIEFNNCLDIITTNGLNIYAIDGIKMLDLYKKFHNALKHGGILITSFITPSPLMSDDSIWNIPVYDNLKKEHAIFYDIIKVGVVNFQTESELGRQLEDIGFEIIDIIYDSKCVFPTVVARKKEI